MTKGNIIDFAAYVESHTQKKEMQTVDTQDELSKAIELLILRLKESNPIEDLYVQEKC